MRRRAALEMLLKHNDLPLTAGIVRCRILNTNSTRAKAFVKAQQDWKYKVMQNVNANIMIASIIR